MACVIITQELGAFLRDRRMYFNELLGDSALQFQCQEAPQGWVGLLDPYQLELLVNQDSNPNNFAPDFPCWIGYITHLEQQDNPEVAQVGIQDARALIFEMDSTLQLISTGFPNWTFVSNACLDLIFAHYNALANPVEGDDSRGCDVMFPEDEGAWIVALEALQTPHVYTVFGNIDFGTFLSPFVGALNAAWQPHGLSLTLTRALEGWDPEHQANLSNPDDLLFITDCWICRVQHANDQPLVDFVSGWIYLMEEIFGNFILRSVTNPGVNRAYLRMVDHYFANLQAQNQNQ